jgi:hypothetical protein
MSIVTTRQLVERVRGQVKDALQWTPSRFPYELFPNDTQHLQHHAFAVGAMQTEIHSPVEMKRGAAGALCWTTLGIRWAHRMRGAAQLDDYHASLDAEADLLVAINATSRTDLSGLLFETAEREVQPDGLWLIGEMTWKVLHRIALE